ncbi:MAG: N-acetylmuramoyl-L-alanine amidase [Phycisphaerae bacterium]
MATLKRSDCTLVALLALTMLLTGCVSTDEPMPGDHRANLPPPNLAGPRVEVPTYKPTPLPRPQTQPPAFRRPSADKLAHVPTAWYPEPGATRSWTWIVVHHSATDGGSASAFHRAHQNKGWDELGYHFVIGNGQGSGDGVIEVGPRWNKQKWGAHAKTPDNRFNDHGIGICLVGNFENSRPTQAQLRSLARLIGYLMVENNIPEDKVIGHRDTKDTQCPGRYFTETMIRQVAAAGKRYEQAERDALATK